MEKMTELKFRAAVLGKMGKINYGRTEKYLYPWAKGEIERLHKQGKTVDEVVDMWCEAAAIKINLTNHYKDYETEY